ncbi:hypothetical protein JCM11641_002719 [Rhodosporidiobolus odoratus]
MAHETGNTPEQATGTALHPLLSLPSSSPSVRNFLTSLTRSLPEPEIKSYPDIIYLSYLPLGLSLSYHPVPPFNPTYSTSPTDVLSASTQGQLLLTGLDIYNHTAAPLPSTNKQDGREKRQPKKPQYLAFPGFPVLLPSPSSSSSSSSSSSALVNLRPETTGKQLVELLGEPQRKGGGSNATPGVGIWTEWETEVKVEVEVESRGGQDGKKDDEKRKVKIMVEWASAGLQAWEKGAEAKWRVLSLFVE